MLPLIQAFPNVCHLVSPSPCSRACPLHFLPVLYCHCPSPAHSFEQLALLSFIQILILAYSHLSPIYKNLHLFCDSEPKTMLRPSSLTEPKTSKGSLITFLLFQPSSFKSPSIPSSLLHHSGYLPYARNCAENQSASLAFTTVEHGGDEDVEIAVWRNSVKARKQNPNSATETLDQGR